MPTNNALVDWFFTDGVAIDTLNCSFTLIHLTGGKRDCSYELYVVKYPVYDPSTGQEISAHYEITCDDLGLEGAQSFEIPTLE